MLLTYMNESNRNIFPNVMTILARLALLIKINSPSLRIIDGEKIVRLRMGEEGGGCSKVPGKV